MFAFVHSGLHAGRRYESRVSARRETGRCAGCPSRKLHPCSELAPLPDLAQCACGIYIPSFSLMRPLSGGSRRSCSRSSSRRLRWFGHFSGVSLRWLSRTLLSGSSSPCSSAGVKALVCAHLIGPSGSGCRSSGLTGGRSSSACNRKMYRENPLWGAPRILSELQILGFSVSESTISRYMLRIRKSPSQISRRPTTTHPANPPEDASSSHWLAPRRNSIATQSRSIL